MHTLLKMVLLGNNVGMPDNKFNKNLQLRPNYTNAGGTRGR